MVDEPNLGELGRKIEDFRRDVRDDFSAIKSELSQFVLREVYASDEARRNDRFKALEDEQERNRRTRTLMVTLAVTAIIGPIISGVIVYLVVRSLT